MRALLLSFIDRETEALKSSVSHLTLHMSTKGRSQDQNPGPANGSFHSMFILLFRSINAFYLIQYPYLEGSKIGGQRRAGTHPRSPKSKKPDARAPGHPPATSSMDPALG